MVAEEARNTERWRIEGTIAYTEPQPAWKTTDRFRLSIEGPGQSSFVEEGIHSPSVKVCDGTDAWIFSPALNRYRQMPAAGNLECNPIVAEWRQLEKRLPDPIVEGTCGQGAVLVRGATVRRTLCIDPVKRRVEWETWNNGGQVKQYEYQFREPGPAREEYRFKPSPDAQRTDLWLPIMLSDASAQCEKMPKLAKHVPPELPQGRKTPKMGFVTLYIVIGVDGVPRELLMYRGLSPAVDREAIKAVSQWRFTPAIRNGSPVEVSAIVEVSFRKF